MPKYDDRNEIIEQEVTPEDQGSSTPAEEELLGQEEIEIEESHGVRTRAQRNKDKTA